MDHLNSNLQTKDQSGGKIPYEISEYINTRFRKEFLTEIKTVSDSKGLTFYHVDISHENTLYHLQFNAKGILIKEEIEPLLEFEDEEFGIVTD